MSLTIKDKDIHKEVIEALSEYRALKVKFNNLKRREEHGVDELFQVLIDNTIESKLKVLDIEDALGALDFLERCIIERKYLSTKDRTDVDIYSELGISNTRFYDKKRTALQSIAKSLNII